jgi:hypothetical protein
MLRILATVLFILWLIAVVTKHTMAGAIHALLVLALLIALAKLVSAHKGSLDRWVSRFDD